MDGPVGAGSVVILVAQDVPPAFFDTKSCGGTQTPVIGDTCSNSKLGLKLVGGCTLSVTQNGQLQFDNANASTVCCP